jgi:hypothetical protein
MAGRLADLDRDGTMDAVMVNQLDRSLSIYWDVARTRFEEVTELSAARSYGAPAVGDLNGDGWPDLLLPATDESEILLFKGGPDRALQEVARIFHGPAPAHIDLLDVDGDGHLDLLLEDAAQDCVAARRGDGRFGFAEGVCIRSPAMGVVGLGRASGLLLTHAGPSPSLWASHLDGMAPSGEREHVLDLPAIGPGVRLRTFARDVNGDGMDEIYVVLHAGTRARILRAERAEKGWTACRLTEGLKWDGLLADLQDINQDGRVDALGTRTCSGCSSNHVIWLTTGGGKPQPKPPAKDHRESQ